MSEELIIPWKAIKELDAVLRNDYDKGTLSHDIAVKAVMDIAARYNLDYTRMLARVLSVFPFSTPFDHATEKGMREEAVKQGIDFDKLADQASASLPKELPATPPPLSDDVITQLADDDDEAGGYTGDDDD